MSHIFNRLLLLGASIATVGTTLALTSCSQQQPAPQKKGYVTFESRKYYEPYTHTYSTNIDKIKTYDLEGFLLSYNPNPWYKLNDEFMNGVLKFKDEWNIYFYHFNDSYYGNWYSLAEYYNVIYKGVPSPK